MLAVLCPMLLAAMLLLRAFLPLPEPIRWLWAATAIFVALSVAVALILVMIGPWQNRLAGVGLGVVACALLLVREPAYAWAAPLSRVIRSEEHTSELQSLMRISYAVFCFKNTKSKVIM